MTHAVDGEYHNGELGLNKHLGINCEAGLSDLIAGDVSIDRVIRETNIAKLWRW